MRFDGFGRNTTGVAVPVSSLRGSRDCGIGEFRDLPELAKWCASCGFEVIQILPVNDTGFDSSPYNALSAFALNPSYLAIQDLPEFEPASKLDPAIAGMLQELKVKASQPRVQYEKIHAEKLSLAWEIFQTLEDSILEDAQFQSWMRENQWVQAYAVFSALKEANGFAPWWDWPEYSNPARKDVRLLWDSAQYQQETRFHAWLQYRLEGQLVQAARLVEQAGCILKGDIPILMNDDSVDVWCERKYFKRDTRAGAPPDMFSSEGQNWGFPVYDWDSLAKDGFKWWQMRIQQADKFFHAFRIDHVLGFFRIWAVPGRDFSGVLGHFSPAVLVSAEDLHSAGFSDARIRWISQPHIAGTTIRAALGEHAERLVARFFQRIGEEDLFLFRDICGERLLVQEDVPEHCRGPLVQWYRNRALVETVPGMFGFAWYFRDSLPYATLSQDERWNLENLYRKTWQQSEELWAREGERLLTVLKDASGMLPCAEDLGAVPDCVAPVLEKLGILSLRIPRWTRNWAADGQPFVPFGQYPRMSVCAASVHDTSTLRGWWQTEDDAAAFRAAQGAHESDTKYSPNTALFLMSQIAEANSILVMFQLQDIFALSTEIPPASPDDERVNVPGTFGQHNWTYRIPVTIEALGTMEKMNNAATTLTKTRRGRTA